MSVVILDQRQGELRKLGRLSDVLVAVGPVHFLRTYAGRLQCEPGEAFRLFVSGVPIPLSAEQRCCRKCGDGDGPLYASREGLLCFSCYAGEFGEFPPASAVTSEVEL